MCIRDRISNAHKNTKMSTMLTHDKDRPAGAAARILKQLRLWNAPQAVAAMDHSAAEGSPSGGGDEGHSGGRLAQRMKPDMYKER